MTRVIAAYEACGCNRGVFVIDRHPADAYAFAAEESKAGAIIAELDIEEWRSRRMYCDAHRDTQGPPEWPSNQQRTTAPGQIGAGL